MNRITPSFIGTTIATIVAALYTFAQKDPALHLWTEFVRFTVICGPALVLLTYSGTAYLVENQPHGTDIPSALGRFEYPTRILAQIFLCLSLAALSEDLRWYIILFMLFMIVNFIWVVSVYKSMPNMFFYDAVNFVLCAAYALVSLYIYSVAADFERTYPAFALDKFALDTRVTELRGQQLDKMIWLSFIFGAILVNLGWLVKGPWWEHFKATRAARARG